MSDLVPIRRALLSVSDKSGLIDLARALLARGAELISTGGTAATLAAAGFPVTPVETVTGFPEMMDGRVKTLHPKIHGGLLAVRSHPEHQRAMLAHAIDPIDLLVVSLYPFEETVARPGVKRDEAIEQIDIGGPAMIRSAAKNHESVAVVTAPDQYPRLTADLEANRGATSLALRRALALEAFARTSAYDATIARYLRGATPGAGPPCPSLPESLDLRFPKARDLRYGENPHQRAALYLDPAYSAPSVATARQLHGKDLSYNNLNDGAAALALALDLLASAPTPDGTCAAIIKHANPCGAAWAATTAIAVDLALRGDPLAAYGGILAVSGRFDAPSAAAVCRPGVFLEVIIATDFDPEALQALREKSANVRLLAVGHDAPDSGRNALSIRTIPGGALAQEPDATTTDPAAWDHKAGPAPSAQTRRNAALIMTIAKHLASNAIAIGGVDPSSPGGVRLFGAGAGQMDRVTSCRLAVEKAGPLARGAIAASDAFFPFPDGPELLMSAGVATIVHPGGSKRDQETFDLCDRRAVTCLTTGVRHFRH